MELIYEDLTHELIGCFFQVHNTLGVGYDEFTYHKALERRFRKAGIGHRSEERKALMHRGRKVREFKADLITFDKIILELKTLQSNFVRANYVQIISELKLWEMCLGLLVNFGLQKVEIERIPFTEKTKTVQENYDYVRDGMTALDRDILARLRDTILHVFETHGLGYGEVTYRKLVEAELDFRQIKFQHRSPIEVSYEGEIISVFKMKPLLIENRIICDIKALEEKIDFYDIAKIQSYLKALNLKIGLVVNFGKNDLEIRGIRVK
ncbi:MAG: GxxExxY protein [candidate division KSB1 bacterium]|nr:GxxExxY protein [candidate division KSB1 bacterium]MDZ7303116.1 GxxExxY protein [candidate division KSB1 bacterium]MDZ7312655.1 GxxExxY protein [candidate division KSB1 bacterium]MDZ7344580.1 GxxExxY protein [candidate division KSB1 bacterium]